MTSTGISRRRTLQSLGAGGMLALAGCLGDDDDDAVESGTTENGFDGLRIGFLGALTGENGPEFGHQGLTGLLSGLAYKNDPNETPLTNDALDMTTVNPPLEALHGDVLEYTVDDVDIEFHIRNSDDDLRQSARMAGELVSDEEVDLLFGVSNSDGLLRTVNNVVKVNEVPLFQAGGASTATATADASTCDRLFFRATETSAMRARAGANYIIEDPLDEGFERVSIMVADFSFGRSIRDNYRTVLEDAPGIEIVQEVTVPVGTGVEEWQPYIEEAKNEDVDVITYGFTATTGIPFFSAFTTDPDGDVDIPDIRIIGDSPSRLGQREMGVRIQERLDDIGLDVGLEFMLDNVAFGPFTVGYMWNQYDNPTNQRFIQGQREAYGVNPDLFSGSAFASASAIVQALDEEGEVGTDAVVEGVYGMQVEDTPKGQGEYVFQEYNNQARSPLTVAPVVTNEDEYWPAPIQVSGTAEDIFRIDKDELTLQASEISCDLR